jgi:hypothetical protein
MDNEEYIIAMAHWRKEAMKIMATDPEKYRDYHATILMHTHRRGWLEALQWASSQITPDGNPEVALEKISREIKRTVEPANNAIGKPDAIKPL